MAKSKPQLVLVTWTEKYVKVETSDEDEYILELTYEQAAELRDILNSEIEGKMKNAMQMKRQRLLKSRESLREELTDIQQEIDKLKD